MAQAGQASGDLGRPVEGVLWMLTTTLAFVGVNGIVRHLGTELPAAQSAFIRFAFGLVFLAPAVWAMRRVALPAGIWPLFLWRGALHVAAVIFWFWAMARVPVAEMAAIGFLNPVVVLVIAGLLLGEGLGRGRVLSVAVALVGALVVLRPGLREVSLGHLSQLVATLFFAVSYIFAKRLSGMAPASVVVGVLSVTVSLGLAPMAWWVWEPVTGVQLAWLAGVAGLATLGHYTMTRAFRAAPLAVTQPVTFLQILWATLLGALVFDEAVDGFVILGGALIVGAVSLNTWAEARRGRIPPQPEP
ncbi:DMT family transporter [Tabrizicola sp.]|jgi:drug/metabolite transporter (DMT)-like permease|uniref:DMT family transporter n=1 Tax=Tabrizicola sp. TaxID=2005166 RepID=UPI0025F530D1|nr:DMT family transporter [Tabrizicola sp.]MDK2774601.1 DMT family transporter [Tabrizicola sp.]